MLRIARTGFESFVHVQACIDDSQYCQAIYWKLLFIFSEYMYQVLKHNKCKLPEEALYCIRFHSFYPWHTGNDYDHLCNDKDRKMKDWIKKFK